MFRNFRNSRLGRYYAAVLNKYGTITPIAVALLAFLFIFSVDTFGIFGLLKSKSTTAFIITIVALGVAALMALYYAFSRIAGKRICAIDLIIFVVDLVLLLMILELILIDGSTARTILYVVALVLAVALTIGRMAMAKLEEKKPVEPLEAKTGVKSYFAAFAKRYNLVALAVAGIAAFAVLYVLDGAGLDGGKNWTILVAITLVLTIASVLFNIPKRVASKRMGEVDGCLAFALVAAVLYAIPLFINFTVLKLVLWIVALCAIVGLWILVILNTCATAPEAEAVPVGEKGFKIYFRVLSKRYNLILSALLGIVAFAVMYAFTTIDVLFGVKTLTAGGFYIAIDVVVLGFLACLLLDSRRRTVGANDMIGFAFFVFILLAIIPTIQFFSIIRLVCWALLLVLLCVHFAIRIVSVVEVKKEVRSVGEQKVASGI